MAKRAWKDTPQAKYDRQNIVHVNAAYKREFVEEFKEALKVLGLRQSDVIRKCMIETIEAAKKAKEKAE